MFSNLILAPSSVLKECLKTSKNKYTMTQFSKVLFTLFQIASKDYLLFTLLNSDDKTYPQIQR